MAANLQIEFDPLDTFFFRDGSPFNRGELQAATDVCFPPSPQTLIGAARVSMAKSLGWDGKGNWGNDCNLELGDGFEADSLGKLSFRGPFLKCGNEVIVQMPANFLGRKIQNSDGDFHAQNPLRMKPRPGTDSQPDVLDTDLTPCRLPQTDQPPGGRDLMFPNWWIDLKAFSQILKGKSPNEDQLIHGSKISNREVRVGIQRDTVSRTTPTNALYAPQHIRMDQSEQHNVRLLMQCEYTGERDLTHDWHLQPVGGESRVAWIERTTADLFSDALDFEISKSSDDMIQYAAYVLTPIRIEQPPMPGEQDYAELPGKVVSACIPRPLYFGGWDSRHNRPLPLRPHVAPGTVIFIECDKSRIDEVKKLHLNSIGQWTKWGFGMVAIGAW